MRTEDAIKHVGTVLKWKRNLLSRSHIEKTLNRREEQMEKIYKGRER